MKTRITKLFFGCLFLLTIPRLVAEPVKLALTHIPKVLEYNLPNAPYTRLIEELKKGNKLDFEAIYLPSARANKLLNSRKLDCIFPIIPTRSRVQPTTFSKPVNGIYAHIFNTGAKPYRNIKQLHGQSVVYLRGYLFGDLVRKETNIHFLPVLTQQAAFAMLKKNRAAAYIDYVPDINFAFSKQQLDQLRYSKSDPIIRSYDRCECLQTEKARLFLEAFNEEISRLKSTGLLEQILGDYFVSTAQIEN